jgi:putative membrane protein
MFTKRQMPLKMIIRWTYVASIIFIINATIPAILHIYFDLTFLTIPWALVALVGTAVAFLISFQNNAAYDRVWEARKIWGGIVNNTRSFSVLVRDMIDKVNDKDNEAIKIILYRHRAWLTALRFSMREPKPWEIPEIKRQKHKERFNRIRYNPERIETLEHSLKPLLSDDEFKYVMSSPNKASTILTLQSKHFTSLKSKTFLWEFSFLKLEDMICELYTLQGKSERIKNFPYPRQYFTLGVHLTWTFIILLPYAIIPEFTRLGETLAASSSLNPQWFTIASVPFVACVSWIFHTMGRMGRAGENPFEGTIHDVPISAIARNLEIEISHLLGEAEDIRPKKFPMTGAVQL